MIPVITLRADALTAIEPAAVSSVEILANIDGPCALLATFPLKSNQPAEAWALKMLPLGAITGNSRGVPEDSILITPPPGVVPLPLDYSISALVPIPSRLFGSGPAGARSGIVEIEINDPAVEIADFKMALLRWNQPRANN